jgi:hypothetical protein
VRPAPRQDSSGTHSRGDIYNRCGSPPLSWSCERIPAFRASGTTALNDGAEGGSQKKPGSRVAISARSQRQQVFSGPPLDGTSFYGLKEPMATEPTDLLSSAKEPAPMSTEPNVEICADSATSANPISASHPPTSRVQYVYTPKILHSMPQQSQKKKTQARRYRERTLAIAYATGARAPAVLAEAQDKGGPSTWSKARARRGRASGKRCGTFITKDAIVLIWMSARCSTSERWIS